MNEKEIKKLISRGESDTIEFKQKVSSPSNLAVLMTAFANSYGGKILIGVTNKSKVRGIENTQEVINKINETTKLISPKLTPKIEITRIYNKNIIVVDISSSETAPHAVLCEYYHRKGAFSCRANINQL
jgi:ATP-dependent DNA helicase RecG